MGYDTMRFFPMVSSLQIPDWFGRFTSQPLFDHVTNIKGTEIHYQTWNDHDKPGLLFIHGYAAHSHWWDFIAPAFTSDYRVGAIDLSGSGDSGHRQRYSAAVFAEEILTVADQLGNNTTLIGHSFGGSMARVAAYLHPGCFSGLVLVDSVIPQSRGSRKPPPMPRLKDHFYPTIETGMKRFRLRPPQPCANQFLVDYIAAKSLKKTNRGYVFKLDQALFSKMKENPATDLPDAATMIGNIDCPTAFIYGENSRFFPPENIPQLTDLFPQANLKNIPDAGHHVFLDQPLDFIRTLEELLANFQRT